MKQTTTGCACPWRFGLTVLLDGQVREFHWYAHAPIEARPDEALVRVAWDECARLHNLPPTPRPPILGLRCAYVHIGGNNGNDRGKAPGP